MGVIVSILEATEQRLREVNSLTLCHTPGRGRARIQTKTWLSPEPVFFLMSCRREKSSIIYHPIRVTYLEKKE